MPELNDRIHYLEKSFNFLKGCAIATLVLVLGYFGFTSFYQIPQAARKAVDARMPAAVEVELKELRDRAKAAAEDAESIVCELEKARNDYAELVIESGAIELEYAARTRPEAGQTSSGKPERGTLNGRVNFAKEFSEAPEVVLALKYVDSSHGENLRVNASVIEVDRNGFNYDLNSWDKTHVYMAKASWIAYGLSTP